MATNNNDIKKLLETFDRKEQWRGDDPNPPGEKLVGETEKFLGEPYIREEEIEEDPAVNRELAKARIPDRTSGEQRDVWTKHYERAKRNGRDDRAARRYADSLTSSESKFQTEDEIEEYADTFDPEKDADTGVHVRQAAQQAPQPKKQDDPRSLDFTSRQFKGIDALVERLTKAYEDYVSNEKYSDDKIYPKKSQKPAADKKKIVEPKEKDPTRVDELFADQGSGSSDKENAEWARRFKKAQAAKKKAQAEKTKKEKPFKDAAATGNPRDFANEAKAPTKEQAKKNDAEWAQIESHWKKLHGKDVQMPSGPAGDQKMRQAWEKSKK